MAKERQMKELFFQGLYLFFSFFVFIGEGVRFFIFLLVRGFFFLLSFILRLIVKISTFIFKLIQKYFFLCKYFLKQIPFKIYYFFLGSVVT